MNLKSATFALLCALMSIGASASSPEGYTLVWHDEFNEPGPAAPSSDLYVTPDRSNAAWARFISSRPGLMVVEDGVLKMYCRPNTSPDAADPGAMVSGAIETRGRFSIRHGRVEARMKVHGYRGSFPAFWMMPDSQPDGWPTAGEIDIFESINDENVAYATLHTGRVANDDITTPGYKEPTDIGEWHVYGLEWTPGEMRFTIDGRVCGTVTRSTINGGLWPFDDNDYYLILNQSVGNGSWAAAADTAHTYLTEVDWVRVYQREQP